MTYGYVRVSSRDQNEERQMIAMQDFGVERKHIYLDKQSGYSVSIIIVALITT